MPHALMEERESIEMGPLTRIAQVLRARRST